MMEVIIPALIQIITGVIGGQTIGAALKNNAMGPIIKLLSGAAGGLAGGTLLGSVINGAMGADPAAGGAFGGVVGDALGGLGGGAIVTTAVGLLLKSLSKHAE